MIKTPQELKLQRFENVETLDSKLKHETFLTFADVRHHLGKGFFIKNILRLVVKKSPTGESTHYFFFVLK